MISGGCGLPLENLASAGTEGETGDEGDPPPRWGLTATPNLKPGDILDAGLSPAAAVTSRRLAQASRASNTDFGRGRHRLRLFYVCGQA